jgi:hypothetical protein
MEKKRKTWTVLKLSRPTLSLPWTETWSH